MTIRMGKLICYTYSGCVLFIIILCVALAVFVRSPAAYEALKGFGLLQLPSRATLQAYTGAFLDSPGTHAHTHMHVCTHVHTHTLCTYMHILYTQMHTHSLNPTHSLCAQSR